MSYLITGFSYESKLLANRLERDVKERVSRHCKTTMGDVSIGIHSLNLDVVEVLKDEKVQFDVDVYLAVKILDRRYVMQVSYFHLVDGRMYDHKHRELHDIYNEVRTRVIDGVNEFIDLEMNHISFDELQDNDIALENMLRAVIASMQYSASVGSEPTIASLKEQLAYVEAMNIRTELELATPQAPVVEREVKRL